MIHFDITKAGWSGHRSGLTRVSSRLRGALGDSCTGVVWNKGWRDALTGRKLEPGPGDWIFTAELFSEEERPGFTAFLAGRRCRVAALFHDAIPLRFPKITWPQSVARHPTYLKLLASFDRVMSVSDASRRDLLGIWEYQEVARPPAVDVLPLGADFDNRPRRKVNHQAPATGGMPQLLCVGILEPRKNQLLLLEACESLWAAGLRFGLHLVGRVNPHFGAPVAARAAALRKSGRPVVHHDGAGDEVLAGLYSGARATVFPTIAEGCGLPVLESLWMGVPCVCSDLPVLRENADGGGCLTLKTGDTGAWCDGLRAVLTDDALVVRLRHEAATRPLTTWADTAKALRAALDVA